MSTTPQNDSVGTSNSNGSSTGNDEPKVIIDPAILADGAQASSKVEKTEQMPVQPDATTASTSDGTADASAAAGSSPADPAATLPAANASKDDEDEEPKLPTNDGRNLKFGLAAAAIVGAIGLFVIAYAFVRNTPATTTVVVPSAPAGVTAPVAPGAVVPEVRTPAPRRIDATGCTRGQYAIEGNELVFRNCALLELAEPAGR